MITEILILPLKASADISDPSSSAGKAIREILAQELTAQGARYAYYGQFIERPDTAVIFVNWDSFDEHRKFMGSLNYETHVSNLKTIVKDPDEVITLHVPFGPSDDISSALGANSKVGVTEVVFFYFPSTQSSSDRDAVMSSVDKMRPSVDRSESLAVYDGWALEEAPNPGPQASKGDKSKVFMNVVGWADVDAHVRFTASEDFQQNVPHLMGMKDMQHTGLYHVKLYAA